MHSTSPAATARRRHAVHAAARPPGGWEEFEDTFVVPGVAVITAAPHRSRREARSFAQRIAADPVVYLGLLARYGVPGIDADTPLLTPGKTYGDKIAAEVASTRRKEARHG